MSPLHWGLFLLGAGAAFAAVLHVYRRREMPGRGRLLLAMLRWAALALLILLLLDPELPAPGLAAGGARMRVLVDRSLSMSLPVRPGDDGSRWQRALELARRETGAGDVVAFGEQPRVIAFDSLAVLEPGAPSSRLVPALQAATEAGAQRVLVITDGGIEDAAELPRALELLGTSLEVRAVGEPLPANRALVEVAAPAWAEAGTPAEIRVGIAATAATDEVVSIEIREASGAVVARGRVEPPAPGQIAPAVLRFAPSAPVTRDGGALVRYEARLLPDDVVPDDDRRTFYMFVGDRPAGVAVVSFRGDWELRFLQPVLEQSLGLPVRGFLRLASGEYVRLGAGLEAGARVAEEVVRAAAQAAELVVFHGLGPAAPAWARERARSARRVLIFPAADAADAGLPVRLGAPATGDWYLGEPVPASPVAPLLAGLELGEVPPLSSLRAAQELPEAWAPLHAGRGRRSATAPILLAAESAGRRWAVALGEGYWQWAFRGGTARQAYQRLWAALGGWLVREERTIAAGAVRPVSRVAPRGEPLRWVAPGLAADSIAITLTGADGRAVLDTIVPMLRGDTARTRVLAPGHYRYAARALAAGREVARAEGPLSVESFSAEFTRAPVLLAGFTAPAQDAAARRGPPGKPLHASAWPYLALVLLLCTEWVLRRRWGLR